MKKTKPTPRSITHKNPIYISESFNNKYRPAKRRYRPAVYRSIIMFELIKKYKTVRNKKTSNTLLSINTNYTKA